jgi:hypothetical protein
MGRLASVVSVVAVAGAAAVLAAPAAGAGGPWIGIYSIVLTGSQNNTWSMNHQGTGVCDPSATGSGSETAQLTADAGVVTITGSGSVPQFPKLRDVAIHASLDREGSITEAPTPPGVDTSDCANGDAYTPPPPDCGSRTTTIPVDLVPNGTGLEIDNPQVDDSTQAPPPLFQNCPNTGAILPYIVTPLLGSFAAAGFGPTADGGLPVARATFRGSQQSDDPELIGGTTDDITLVMPRASMIDAMGLPDGLDLLGVNDSGTASLPLSCPAGAGCSGSVALQIDVPDASARAASSDGSYPAPIGKDGAVVAHTSFDIRAHHHGSVKLNLHSRGTRFVSSLHGVSIDVVVSEHAGKHTLRYAVGQVTLQARHARRH